MPQKSEETPAAIRMTDSEDPEGGERMRIEIRPMQTEDEIRGKAYVHWKSWQETYPGLIDQSRLDAMTVEKCEKIAFRFPESTLIAKDGARVIGFSAYGPCRDDDLPDTGEVVAIYVLSEYWGSGAGPALMQAALERLDFPQTAVWVLKGNGRAIRFYEKYGFRFDGCEKALAPGSTAAELRMIRNRPAEEETK